MLDPLRQGGAKLGRQLAGLLVASGGIRGDDDRTQIAEVELGHLGERSLGLVAPFSSAHGRHELLGECEQGSRADLRAILGPIGLVLLLDRSAHRRDASAEELFGDGSLLLGERGKHRIAMDAAGAESLRLGLRFGRRVLGSSGTRLAVAAVAIGAIALRALAIGALTALARRSTGFVAIATGSAIAASLALLLRCKRGGHELVVVATRGADDLDALRLLAGPLGGEHREDHDAVEHEVGVGAHDVAHLRSLIEQGAREFALRQLGAGSTPGPGSIVT